MINRITPVSFGQFFGAKLKTVGETAKVKKTSTQNSLEHPQTGDVFTSSQTKSEKGHESNVSQKKTETNDTQDNKSQINQEN